MIEKQQKKDGFIEDHARFVHVEVSLGGSNSVNVAPPKTRIIDFREVHTGRYLKIVRFKDNEYEVRKRYKVGVWGASLCNLPYDFMGVLKFKIPWLFHSKGLYFCSEAALSALQKEFPGATGIKPYQCMPAHFCLPKYFDCLWEGLID